MKDPALNGENCIYAEATSGDGGVHSAPIYWLSPDIQLLGSDGVPDRATWNQDNHIRVTVRRKSPGSGENDCHGLDADSVSVDLYLANPALAMRPDDAKNVTLLTQFSVTLDKLPAGGSAPIPTTPGFVWNPKSTGVPYDVPHRCLVARCYPSDRLPSGGNFFLPDDPHVVQHNIAIVVPQALHSEKKFRFQILTSNLDEHAPEGVVIRAEADLNPDARVRAALMPGLKLLPNFHGHFATNRSIQFGLDLPDFPQAIVRDNTGARAHTGAGGRLATQYGLANATDPPRYDAQIQLKPAQTTKLAFTTDFIGFQKGSAHVFHLRQIGKDGRTQGGLTLVLVP